jgi:hypothetical protein
MQLKCIHWRRYVLEHEYLTKYNQFRAQNIQFHVIGVSGRKQKYRTKYKNSQRYILKFVSSALNVSAVENKVP